MPASTPLAATCPRCHAAVLEARWDYQMNTIIGRPLLDPHPLNQQQILACIITGIQLWQIHQHAGRPATSMRWQWWPTRPVAGHTVSIHACHRTWPGDPVRLAPDIPVYPDTCPY